MNEQAKQKRLKMASAKIDTLKIGPRKPDCVDFNTLLRITSGQQDSEPDVVLVEHSYSRPWNWQPGLSCSRPRKTLFLHRPQRQTQSSEEEIDVTTVESPNTIVPYDLNKGRTLMNECERHASTIQGIFQAEHGADTKDEDGNSDDEDKVDRSSWTEAQSTFYDKVMEILDSYQLAKLALVNTPNEPVRRRAMLDKAASKFRLLYYNISWDPKLTIWLHNYLLHNMKKSYLASYFDVLQTLKAKIPGLVDNIISQTAISVGTSAEAVNLLLKRPWDPISPSLGQYKPRKLDKLPIIIQIPAGASSTGFSQVSRRTRFFNSQLQHLAKTLTFSVQSEASNPGAILDRIVVEAKTRIIETKNQFPNQPIVLLGWGVGAVLAGLVSLVEKVTANIFLGLPMTSHSGNLGESNDPLLDQKTPTLFIAGGNATNATIDDLEQYRYRMKAVTSLVVIADADERIKLSQTKRYVQNLTQSMVDRCMVDEIGDFLTSVLNGDFQDGPGADNAANRAKNRDAKKRRHLEAANQSASKIFRAGTNLSQNLGLKIPITNPQSVADKRLKTDPQDIEADSSGAANRSRDSFGESRFSSKSSGLSTISLGSIGSVSNQKYRRMIQLSDQNQENTFKSAPKGINSTNTVRKPILPKTGHTKRGRPPGKGRARRAGMEGAAPVGRPPNKNRKTEEKPVTLLTMSGKEDSQEHLPNRGVIVAKGRPSTMKIFSGSSKREQSPSKVIHLSPKKTEMITDEDGTPIITVDSLTQISTEEMPGTESSVPEESDTVGCNSETPADGPDMPIVVPAPLSFFSSPKNEKTTIEEKSPVKPSTSSVKPKPLTLHLQRSIRSPSQQNPATSKPDPGKIQILGRVSVPSLSSPTIKPGMSSGFRVVQGVVKKDPVPIKITSVTKPNRIVTKQFTFTQDKNRVTLSPSVKSLSRESLASTKGDTGESQSPSRVTPPVSSPRSIKVSFSSTTPSRNDPRMTSPKGEGVTTRSKDEFKFVGSTRKGSKFRSGS